MELPGINHVAIIGGGRWARVVTETLIGLLPDSVMLSLHSVHNSLYMNSWAIEKGVSNRIKIYNLLPEDLTPNSAVIVVNASRDHALAAAHCLGQGACVLVEKPMATTFDEVNNLRNIARQKHAILAPAHVFMFADYIQMYIKSVRASESIKQITVVWTDPKSETRYGEKKSYDPGLPIIADLLPHIISLSSALFKQVNPIFSNIALTKGGQNVLMELKYGSIPCAIKMARNDASRKRFIKVDTVSSSIELDFTNEPAIFKYTSDKNAVTLEIVNEDRPLRKLLRMFLAGCSSGSLDNRFDLEVGLQISQITDQAINAYEKLQTSWIFDNISGEIEEDMVYAITETFQVNKILNSEQLEQSITEFQNWLYYMNKCHQKIDIADIQLKLKSISSILKD